MKIHNVRLGFATNSSSSHSIVIMPDGERWGDRDTHDNFSYGWEDFCLTNPQSKLEYVATALYQNLRNDLSVDESVRTVKDMFGIDVSSALDGDGWGAGIDHQSSISTPSPRRNKKFWKGFGSFIQDDRVAVLGGNDNSEGNGYDDLPFVDMIRDGGGSGVKIKNDGDYWVMFNVHTGAKIRFSFDVDKFDAEGYEKSAVPELVDLKITDYCTMGCDFCLTPDTKINTINGVVPINDIIVGDEVIVYQDDKINTEFVEDVYVRDYNGDIIEIETENGEMLQITPEHEVFTTRGWIKAGELFINDELLHI